MATDKDFGIGHMGESMKQAMNKMTIKYAFKQSLPVMAGYLVLGMGFGILLKTKGYGVTWAFFMSLFIYAGSMQFVLVPLLASAASPLTVAVKTLFVNSRHIFFGLSFIEYFKKMKSLHESKHQCTLLPEHKTKLSNKYCKNCTQWLCDDCIPVHNKVNPTHLVMANDFKFEEFCYEHKTKAAIAKCKKCNLQVIYDVARDKTTVKPLPKRETSSSAVLY